MTKIDTAEIRHKMDNEVNGMWLGENEIWLRKQVRLLCDEIDRLRAEVQGRDVDLECRGETIDKISREFHKKIAQARAAALEEKEPCLYSR